MSIVTTKDGQKIVKTSATNLNLNVTSEDEFKSVYKGYRDGIAKTAEAHKKASQALGNTARKNLWNDLGAALAVCDVLMAEGNEEWLADALDSHGIALVEDPARANEFLPVVRLLMGYFPAKPKDWKADDPEPAFTWDRRVEKYAKVLRAAKHLKLTPQGLVDRLTSDKGFTKLQKKDDDRNLNNDAEEQERVKRFKAIQGDTPKAVIPAEPFGLPVKDRPSMVALWAMVSPDGTSLNIQGRMDTSDKAIETYINRVSKELYRDMAVRRMEAMDQQPGGLTVREQVHAVAEKVKARIAAAKTEPSGAAEQAN